MLTGIVIISICHFSLTHSLSDEAMDTMSSLVIAIDIINEGHKVDDEKKMKEAREKEGKAKKYECNGVRGGGDGENFLGYNEGRKKIFFCGFYCCSTRIFFMPSYSQYRNTPYND